MKKTLAKFGIAAMFLVPMALALPANAATTWDTTGSYDVNFTCLVGCPTGPYAHDMNLTQDSSDNLTGSGGNPANGVHTYTWVLTSGSVSGNNLTLTANYTATADAVTPQTVMQMSGTIAGDGTMSGTWSDNYQGGTRSGTWVTTSGTAAEKPAVADLNYTVNPVVYDPFSYGHIVAEWTQVMPENALDKNLCKKDGWKGASVFGSGHPASFKNQGQCVSYADNWNEENSEYYLSLEKNAPTSEWSSATAELVGEEGITLTELGFDYMGYCGAGAPRFNVYTTSGVYYFFGCTYGTHTDAGDGWTQVRFTNADAFPSDGTTAFPGFGSVVVTDIEIIMDEEGQTKLDNIDVNGVIVGQP